MAGIIPAIFVLDAEKMTHGATFCMMLVITIAGNDP
jgi:hypothetical protein